MKPLAPLAPAMLPCSMLLGAMLVGAASTAQAQSRIAVQDVKALLLAAIEAPSGRAQGILTGELADAITRRFKGSTPIYIDVSTERRYSQQGCSRLQVRFWQDGVQLPEVSAPRRQTIDFGIDYCRDGLPPKSRS